VLHIGLSLSILKSASNKSLSSVKSVFGVLYGLDKSVYNIKINIIN
jgi:hypothetical protein